LHAGIAGYKKGRGKIMRQAEGNEESARLCAGGCKITEHAGYCLMADLSGRLSAEEVDVLHKGIGFEDGQSFGGERREGGTIMTKA